MSAHKTQAALIAGALVTLVTWALQQFAHVTVPAEAAAAATTLVTVVLVYIVPNQPEPPPADDPPADGVVGSAP